MLSAQQRATFMGQEFDQAFQSRVQNSARIGDIANMNFTAEQQVQLENSRAANTMNLNNLSNSQAMVNGRSMLHWHRWIHLTSTIVSSQQYRMHRHSCRQTWLTCLINSRQSCSKHNNVHSLCLLTKLLRMLRHVSLMHLVKIKLTSSSANLGQQTSQFNATQQNAQAQFNAGQANTVESIQC